MKVAVGRWDRIQTRAEYARQAHLIDPAVICRERRILRYDVHTGQLCKERGHWSLAGKHDMAANARQIAGKLYRVAKTLFRMHEDRAARRVAAVPLRPGKVDEVAPIPIVPLTPFIFAEAEREVARQ